MNAKLRKLVKITAAGLFLIALAINVKVSLEDPFTMVNEKAMAQNTTLSCPSADYAPNAMLSDYTYTQTITTTATSGQLSYAQRIAVGIGFTYNYVCTEVYTGRKCAPWTGACCHQQSIIAPHRISNSCLVTEGQEIP